MRKYLFTYSSMLSDILKIFTNLVQTIIEFCKRIIQTTNLEREKILWSLFLLFINSLLFIRRKKYDKLYLYADNLKKNHNYTNSIKKDNLKKIKKYSLFCEYCLIKGIFHCVRQWIFAFKRIL